MTDTRDPRYMRMAGLTLLALLLVVASCQVEQVSINIDVEQVTPDTRGQMTPDARADAIERSERILRARIEELIYLGDHIRVRMSVSKTDDFVVKVRNASSRPALSVGEELNVGWHSKDCRALDFNGA